MRVSPGTLRRIASGYSTNPPFSIGTTEKLYLLRTPFCGSKVILAPGNRQQ